jgi:hypothetical protein
MIIIYHLSPRELSMPAATMKCIGQSSPMSLASSFSSLRVGRTAIGARRCIHSTPPNPATIVPITAHGPPPKAPQPSAEHVDARVARRRKQAELLKRGQDMRASNMKPGSAAMKRFWKDVHVHQVEGSSPPHGRRGAYANGIQRATRSTSTSAPSGPLRSKSSWCRPQNPT